MIKDLEKIKEKYLNDKTNNIIRHALNNTSISDLSGKEEEMDSCQNQFSCDLKTAKATDQSRSGRCWIFSALNVLREKIIKKYNLEDFELSQNYIAFYDKLEKCNFFMEKIIELRERDYDDRLYNFLLKEPISDGGQWQMFINLVKKYGVVPKSAFRETFQSSNTREIDKVLNRYLRKFAIEIRDLNEQDIIARKESSIEEIYRLLCNCFGVPKEKFDFEYVDKDKNYHIIKDLNPKSFFELLEINLDDYVSIINSPTPDKPFNKTYTITYLGNVVEGDSVTHLNLDIERINELVVKQLLDQEPVWFGSDCSKDSDRKRGIWNCDYFDKDLITRVDTSMTKKDMLLSGESTMNHAMVITGVNLDNNKPTKWKIENSWGEDTGNKGYFVASTSWFNNYVYQVVINKKYLTEEEKASLEQESIKLNPWDPMGTLAK